eukprot:TRINITY_DN10190_c0_g2_i1.p1 TRINITY_DN10190_c0_g2~~TRINITY_DN10190_c0_g2_i1.p1  ORF type:complete len:429 (+),score=88.62 TRINITY_DN10190_c0_g2_i1:89-1375(+)
MEVFALTSNPDSLRATTPLGCHTLSTHIRSVPGHVESSQKMHFSSPAALLLGCALFVRSFRSRQSRGSRLGKCRRAMALESVVVSEDKVKTVKSIFDEVLDMRPPAKLDTFLAVLQGSGFDISGEGEWKKIGGDLHPFVFPLATRGAWDDDNLEVVGFLVRQPHGGKLTPDKFQIVTQKPRISKFVHLLAVDMESYIAKRAEEATFRKEKQDKSVIEATKDVYEVKFSGKDQTALDKWLLLEVGPFPDVYKHLAEEHIQAGDPKSGLVIADTMRESSFSAWAFPHSYVSQLLSKYFDGNTSGLEDRSFEAMVTAQQCFKAAYPLWTLQKKEDLDTLMVTAELPRVSSIDDLRVFYLKRSVNDQRAAVRTGEISAGQAAMARAQGLMDAVVCGHKTYNRIRQELSDTYDEVPGCESLVDMIYYFKQEAA